MNEPKSAVETTELTYTGNTNKNTKPKGKRGEKLVPWKPGQSGNPNGRPKTPREMILQCRDLTPEVLTTWIDIMRNLKAKDTDRLRASENIFERAYGKAPQVVELQGENGAMLPIIQVTFAGPTDVTIGEKK